MMYVRVKCYNEGLFTGCDELYSGCTTMDDGIQKFRKQHPEHENCLVIAEWYDAEEPCNKEHFAMTQACGCVY